MGIHFVCHHCSYALHVKDFQAGKRGKCPSCNGSFRIPTRDASYSSTLEDVSENQDVSKVKQAFKKINSTNGPGATSDSSGSISIVLEPNPSANGQASIDKPLPVAFANATDAKWFVRPPSGGQFGPAPASLLASWVAESRVTADSLLCQEGTSEWQMASTLLPELFAADQTAIGSLVAAQSSAASAIIDPAVVRSDAIQKKRMKKRSQQLTLVVLLATVSMVLFSILIFVLVFQNGKPPV